MVLFFLYFYCLDPVVPQDEVFNGSNGFVSGARGGAVG
jgi:hypothetical protein